MKHHIYYKYLEFNDEKFFTICLLPEKNGKFPIVISRSPYVNHTVDMPEEKIVQDYYNSAKRWLERGYAFLFQHCRGQGKSTGAFVTYVHEREDGLAFLAWIREQSFITASFSCSGNKYSRTRAAA